MARILKTDSGTPYLRHRGATVHLVRRNSARKAGVYSARFRVRGREYLRATGCTELAAAAAAGRALYDAMADGDDAAAEALQWRRTCATVGELLAYYEQHAPVRHRTVLDNTSRLRRFLRETGAADPEAVPLSALTRERLEGWIATRQGTPAPDRRTLRPENAGIMSDLRGIRSLFAARRGFRDDMARALQLPPGLEAFVRTPGVRTRQDRFRALDPARLACMDTAAEGLRTINPPLWAAYWMMRLLALRTGEVAAARRHWVEPTPTGHALVVEDRPGEFQVKNGARRVLPLPLVLAGPLTREPDFLVAAASPSARHDLVYRELSAFVRRWFPDAQKSTYLLRKQRASEWLQETGDIATVAYRLGDRISTVEAHYLDVIQSTRDARREQQHDTAQADR